ncbi:hypothetical protein FHT36_000765 [Xanthobacter sp. SG618]|uniref:hypothetical protein n=1 Tax=Xanthobacter sp. SG618 TaxID=2587121 RepID=UPI00145F655B|nr:hypothetical protein [Xanthobacter sp. SG618]NMN56887.1 hypothetical protein [Xanthobacter sp. SG618]
MGKGTDSERLAMLEAELRGRLMTVETILMALTAHVAAHTNDPARFTAQAMGDTENALRQAAQSAPKEMAQTAAFALGSFEQLSGQMLAHLNRHARPQGRG